MQRIGLDGTWEKQAKFKWIGHPESMHEIQELSAKIRDAEDDAAKAEARNGLAKALDGYFEEDMKRREEELAKVEERVKKLRALLEKRAAKKSEIIQLQIKVLENEADGLGFFNNSQAPGAMGWSIFPPHSSLPVGEGGGAMFMGPEGNMRMGGYGGGREGGGVRGRAITVEGDVPGVPAVPPRAVRPAQPRKPRPGATPRAATTPYGTSDALDAPVPVESTAPPDEPPPADTAPADEPPAEESPF
jgi:hypothetical protein